MARRVRDKNDRRQPLPAGWVVSGIASLVLIPGLAQTWTMLQNVSAETTKVAREVGEVSDKISAIEHTIGRATEKLNVTADQAARRVQNASTDADKLVASLRDARVVVDEISDAGIAMSASAAKISADSDALIEAGVRVQHDLNTQADRLKQMLVDGGTLDRLLEVEGDDAFIRRRDLGVVLRALLLDAGLTPDFVQGVAKLQQDLASPSRGAVTTTDAAVPPSVGE